MKTERIVGFYGLCVELELKLRRLCVSNLMFSSSSSVSLTQVCVLMVYVCIGRCVYIDLCCEENETRRDESEGDNYYVRN